MKRKLLLLAALVASALSFNANAQTDVTAKASETWNGASGNYAPAAGSVTLKENYVTNTAETGKILYQTVSGLDEGYYKVTLYANASYTPGRGFASQATDGDLDRTFIYAQGDGEQVKVGIPVNHGVYVSLSGEATVTAHVGSSKTLEFGITKELDGSNWHSIGVKSIFYYGDDTEIIKGELVAEIATATGLSVSETEQSTLNKAIAVAQGVADKSDATFAEIEDAIRELQIAEKFARLGFSAATIDNPVATDFLQNGNFANYDSKDWPTGGWVSLCDVTNHGRKDANGAWENWREKNVALYGKMFNRMTSLPNGAYSVSIDAFCNTEGAAYVYANGERQTVEKTNENVLNTYSIPVVVKNNILEVGLYAGNTSWVQIHNVSVSYTGDPLATYKNTLQALLEEGGELCQTEGITEAYVTKLTTVLEQYNNYDSYTEEEEFVNAISALKAAIEEFNAYITAKQNLDAMKALTESTNVYTAEAYETYYGQWAAKFDAGTLTNEEAAALVDPSKVYDWHSENEYDDFLLSTWTVGGEPVSADFPEGQDRPFHVNTWSIEGDNDGTNFGVPFFEYWTGNTNSLGAYTMTATVEGLNAGVYEVSAWVRVRTKDNTAAADAKGITLSVNGGEAVAVTTGEQTVADGNGWFILEEYKATGIVNDGTLKINFDVAADNNISWLAFKNVNYTLVNEIINVDGLLYAVKSENLIENGSFEEGFTGWTASKDFKTELSPNNYELKTAGAQDGEKYLFGKITSSESSVNGASGAASLGTAWQIAADKTYLFSYYVKSEGTIGKDGTKYLKTTLTNTPKGDDTGFYLLGTPEVTPNGEWCQFQKVFTNDTPYSHIQISFRWLDRQWGFDNFTLYEVELLSSELDIAKIDANKELDALTPVGDGMFKYSQTDIDAARAAIEAAESVEAVKAVAMPKMALPVANQAYAIENANAKGSLAAAGTNVMVVPNGIVYFTSVDGGYVLSNAEGEYIFKTSGNDWTLSTTKDLAQAYRLTVNVVDGGYTLKGSKGLLGIDNKNAGSAVYANKGVADNGVWSSITEADVTYAVKVTDAGYATWVAPADVSFAGTEVYIVENVTEGDDVVAQLTTVENATEGTAVIVKAEEAEEDENKVYGYAFPIAESANSYENNMLKVSEGEKSGDGIYVLAKLGEEGEEVVGFYALAENYSLPAGKVYLDYTATRGVKFIGFGGSNTTGIQEVENAATAVENAVIYNIAGQRVSNPTKGGIYIINGKKVLVK